MATVRIYKVAELLNTSSQEVIALLKRDHGIEVKSASSTIEEVVARQFVDRLARQRNISVPANASFADTPRRGRARGRGRRKAPEPPKPAAPALPPPRLVKSAKPATPPRRRRVRVRRTARGGRSGSAAAGVSRHPCRYRACGRRPGGRACGRAGTGIAETVPAAAPEEPVVTARAPEAPVESRRWLQ